MNVVPIPGEPILLLEPEGKGQKVLVVADLHLGLEASLRRVGMHLPSQTLARTNHILKVLKHTGAKRLVLLGDIKHSIGGFSGQERDELPEFFKELLSKVKALDVVIGNHDGSLKDVVPEGVRFHQHLVIDNVGLTHGHSWPPEEVMRCDHIIMGHEHPTVMFLDELSQRTFYPAWVRTKVHPSKAEGRYKGIRAGATGLIMPAFDDLGCGTPVNLKDVKLLGPLVTSGVFDMAGATVHLVDGTFLGELRDLTVTDLGLVKEQEEMGPAGRMADALEPEEARLPKDLPEDQDEQEDDGGSEE